MPGYDQTGGDDPIEAALELARDVAPDLDAILLTLYPCLLYTSDAADE